MTIFYTSYGLEIWLECYGFCELLIGTTQVFSLYFEQVDG